MQYWFGDVLDENKNSTKRRKKMPWVLWRVQNTWPDVNKCMYLQRILLNMFRQYKCILSFYPGRCQTNLGSCLSNDTLFQIAMRLVLSLYTPILRNIIKLYLFIKFISKTSVRYPYMKTRLHNCLMERLWVKWTDQSLTPNMQQK